MVGLYCDPHGRTADACEDCAWQAAVDEGRGVSGPKPESRRDVTVMQHADEGRRGAEKSPGPPKRSEGRRVSRS